VKTSCAVTLLALLDASSAHAGSLIGALINGSGARLTVRNCGTGSCGVVSWGGQKFVVRRSDIPALFKDFDPKTKPVPAERDKTVVVDRPKPAEAAPPAGTVDHAEDPAIALGRNEEPAIVQSAARPALPSDERPGIVASAKEDIALPATKAAPEAPRAASPSPIGNWIAENGEGRVRIDPCGQALCGLIAAAGPDDTDWRNPDPGKRDRPLLGVPVLIDMKPTNKQRWEGQVYSARSGYTYAATMTLKSADVLRVEGCVLGLFCNGQNWMRAKDASEP
jgi:uncharacterized protein (DUF2147 family)